ncbi:hypothetical protein V5799_024059 [Amblyomma americanum]|uniref:Cation-transporting ATPase n=1 Tax=Amblyomma americanum TaxID=6943 RepID=A0AAQ4ED32_AMBAM
MPSHWHRLGSRGITQEVHGYAYSSLRQGLYRALSVLSLGLLPLVASWNPGWYIHITCKVCQLSRANVVVIKDSHSRLSISEVIVHPLGNRRLSLSGSYQTRKRAFSTPMVCLVKGSLYCCGIAVHG